jgi:hypothetical protein
VNTVGLLALLVVGLLTWPAMPQTVPDEFLRVHRQGIGPIKLGMTLEISPAPRENPRAWISGLMTERER